MVKRGGTKRKAEIKKITDKNSKATTFTKRRDGLFSKAAQLCLLGDAQIAVLATPSSSHSNVSFFSFGHSSVDSVVSAYLSGQRPAPVPVPEESKEMREDIGICMARKDLGLGYWWDDEKLARSKDPQEIMQAIESIKILQRDAKRLLEDEAIDFDQREGSLVFMGEKNQSMSKCEVDQTLIVEDDQIMSVCDSFCNNDKNSALSTPVDVLREGSLAVSEKNEKMSKSEVNQTLIVDDELLRASSNDIAEQTIVTTKDDQIYTMSVCDSFCNNDKNAALSHAEEKLEEWSDMDLEQLLCDDLHDKNTEEEDEVNTNNNNALLLPAAAEGLSGEQELIDYDIANLDLDTMFEGLNSDEFASSFLMCDDESVITW